MNNPVELNHWVDLEKQDKIINQITSEILYSSDADSDSKSESMWRKSKHLAEQSKFETKMDTCQLISLDLNNCNVKQIVMNVLLTACHSLKKLSLRNTVARSVNHVFRYNALLKPFMFEIICNQNGQTLQTLNLTFTYGTSWEFLPSDMMLIVTKCVVLREVNFSGCRVSKNCVKILVNNTRTSYLAKC